MAKGQVVTGLDAALSARRGMVEIFDVRIRELWSWEEYLSDPGNVRELHDMRIAAKRLRYLFEFFESCFGTGLAVELDRFKRLQDYLGEIHDCDVWVDSLRRQLRAALKETTRAGKALNAFNGAQPGLKAGAEDLAAAISASPARGLLLFIAEVVGRRGELYNDLTEFWSELSRSDFRGRLTALTQDAAGEAPAPGGDTDG